MSLRKCSSGGFDVTWCNVVAARPLSGVFLLQQKLDVSFKSGSRAAVCFIRRQAMCCLLSVYYHKLCVLTDPYFLWVCGFVGAVV
jgi:hypothetical protein